MDWRGRRTGSEMLAKALWVRSLARERMLAAAPVEDRCATIRGRELVEAEEAWWERREAWPRWRSCSEGRWSKEDRGAADERCFWCCDVAVCAAVGFCGIESANL